MLPLGLTYFVLRFMFNTLDNVFGPVFARYTPYDAPGVGLAALLVLALALGTVASSRAGRAVWSRWEACLAAAPLVGGLYQAAKALSSSFGSSDGEGFTTVVRVAYPSDNAQSIGFLVKRLDGDMNLIYIPSTPMPNTGQLALVATAKVVRLDMTAARAMQLLVSAGSTARADELNGVKRA